MGHIGSLALGLSLEARIESLALAWLPEEYIWWLAASPEADSASFFESVVEVDELVWFEEECK